MTLTSLQRGQATSGGVDLPALVQIGTRLRDAGLTTRGLGAWAGTTRLAALPARLDELAVREPTPAAAMLALFVGGAELSPSRPRVPSALVDLLIAHGLVEHHAGCLRARVAIVPVARALLVCDRRDAAHDRARVCWPDDSSYHLATAIPPGRRTDWLDVGCGSAFAGLARPELATRMMGVDLNERAVRYARLGAALSGIMHLTASVGDVGDVPADREGAELVTCNAPMPAPGPRTRSGPPSGSESGSSAPSASQPDARPPVIAELWRHADPGMFERLWPALRRAVRAGGTIVVHAATDAMLPVLRDAGGERVVVTYTPETVRGFAVAWWRPDAADRFVATERSLTPERPHLDVRDRDDALVG